MAAREMNPSELRLRLVFNNGVLSKTQKRNGLKRSWVLLKPHFQSICDVVSYILHSFDLHDSCPHGIILVMDGFVLPEFESISILNDKDLISVKRKETRSLNASKAVQEATTYIDDGIVEKLPLPSGVKLLANEEFDKETGGYPSESEKDEDEGVKSTSPVQNTPNGALASKKRKSSSKLESAKKKRKVQAISNTDWKKHLHESEHIKKSKKKRKHESRSNQPALRSPDVMKKFSNELVPESKSESELDENKEDAIQASAMPDKTKKVSRSTLRKKKKRVLKRSASDEAKKVEQLCERQQPVKDMTMDTGSKKEMVANIIQQYDEDSDAEGDLVPVVIRPGLIRFTSSGKVKDIEENQEAKALDVNPTENGTWEDHSGAKNVSDNQIVKETYCWNVIPGKRLGQKWGQTSNTHSSSALDDRNQSTSSWQESGESNGQFNNTWADKKHHLSNRSVNFDKLDPLVDLPKEDVWEKIIEAVSAKEARLMQEDNWNKKETGAKWPSSCYNEVQDDAEKVASKLSSQKPPTPGLANGKRDVWEEITEAASANKAQLMLEDNCNKKETGAKWPSSSYNQVQDDTKKVASKLSSQKPPTPGLANGKRDVWEEITEAASAKKAQLMLEDNWNRKETGAKWPSSSYNQAQDDAKKVASKLSSQKPPTPGLANGKRDLWEEMSEAASAKKAQLMLEDNWNKKDTGAKWPSSLYNQVQDDAKKVASELSNQKLPTPGLANGEKDVWEEITEAASAKKAQLMQENNWNKKETGAKWPSFWYNEVQDDAKKVASDPSIQKPPTPGLANGEKDVSEELTKATSAKKAQLMQEDRWNKEETAAAMVLQQLKQCHWPKAVNEQSQLAKPSESARSIRAQARAHPNPSRCPAKQGSDRKLQPTIAGLRTHKAENGAG